MNTTDKILRWIVLIGIFAVPVCIPFIVSTSMFFPFITAKGFTFRIITEIVFVVWFILTLRNKDYRPKKSWILYALGGFLAVMLLADIFAENPLKAFWSNFERMEGYITLIHIAGYFIVAGSVLNTEKLWRNFFRLNILASVAMSCYGFLQLAGKITINQGGVRLDGTFGNATYLAGYMLFMIFLALFLIVSEKKRDDEKGNWFLPIFGFIEVFLLYSLVAMPVVRIPFLLLTSLMMAIFPKVSLIGLVIALIITLLIITVLIILKKSGSIWRWFYGLALACQLIILYSTATRGALIGLIGGLILVAIIIAIFEKENKLLRKISIITAISVVVLSGLFYAIKDTKIVQSHPSLSRLTSISADSADAKARFMVWGMALEGIKERPILGWGQEGFNFVFNKYYNPDMYGREQWFDRTHSILFDWFIAGGILGFLGYYSLLVLFFLFIWGWKKLPPSVYTLSVTEKALLTGLGASYFFQNIFVFDNIVSYILFFSILAYLHQSRAKPIKKMEDLPIVSIGDTYRFYAPIILVVLVAVLWFANGRNILAAKNLIKALIPQQGGLQENIKYFKSALDLNPFATQEIREQLAQAASGLINSNSQSISVTDKTAFYSFAVSEMKKQVASVPNDARGRIFLGSLYSVAGSTTEAIAQLEEALKLSPQKQVIKESLASAYIQNGQSGKAEELMKSAYESAPQFNDVGTVYATTAIYAGDNKVGSDVLNKIYGTDEPLDGQVLQAYVNTKQFNKAIRIAKAMDSNDPKNVQNKMILAAVYLRADMRSSAIAVLEDAIDKDPTFKAQGEYYIKQIKAGNNP